MYIGAAPETHGCGIVHTPSLQDMQGRMYIRKLPNHLSREKLIGYDRSFLNFFKSK